MYKGFSLWLQDEQLIKKVADLTSAEETIKREQQQIEEMRQRVSLRLAVCGVS